MIKFLLKRVIKHFLLTKEKYAYLINQLTTDILLELNKNIQANCSVDFGKNPLFSISKNSKIILSGKFNARSGLKLTTRNTGSIIIGENVFMNNNCSINCLHKISIGNNVMFGEGVLIYDHNHQHSDKEELFSKQGYKTAPISIGDNCWIGSNTIILKGSIIGNNVVIGAGLVIKGKVKDSAVFVNNQKQVDILNKNNN